MLCVWRGKKRSEGGFSSDSEEKNPPLLTLYYFQPFFFNNKTSTYVLPPPGQPASGGGGPPAQHERDPSTKLRTPFIRGKTPVARRRREKGRQFFAVVARETPFILPPPLIRYLMKSFRPPAPLSPPRSAGAEIWTTQGIKFAKVFLNLGCFEFPSS